jgi:Tfp pilus assembly protein PilO
VSVDGSIQEGPPAPAAPLMRRPPEQPVPAATRRAGAGMAGLVWTLKRNAIRLGWPGMAGVALIVGAAAFYLFGVQPMRQRAADAAAEVKALSERLGSRAPLAGRMTHRGQLTNFYAFFPPGSRLPQLLGQVQHAAQKNSLRLEKGEYRLLQERGFGLARYQITLPLHGSYAQVRSFVNDVLDDMPAVALEELTLKREAVGNPELDARVRFSLFLGV